MTGQLSEPKVIGISESKMCNTLYVLHIFWRSVLFVLEEAYMEHINCSVELCMIFVERNIVGKKESKLLITHIGIFIEHSGIVLFFYEPAEMNSSVYM